MQRDIAVIGMAGRFPGAVNLQQLLLNLSAGRDSVWEITADRVKRTTLDSNREYMKVGYLDDIDNFDYAFFTISPAEAQTMDPHQRLLLEVVQETLDNAAYTATELKKYTTAVFVADAALDYYKQAEVFTPTLATGNTKAFLATLISRQFNFRGNSLLVDTTCSSSLLAVHLACNELLLGDADLALACGANLYLFPYKEQIGLDLDSPDGKSKAFSAKANGMSHGEAVACVLLKPLKKALADGDIIHAVIKGSAVNCNADRAASLTAPDSEAQAEVIVKAWQKAGINPRDIGFIEAHGSGTELGDNIEIGGFTLAFNQFTGDKQFCPVSTIKSNIGHTRAAAGISGMLKAILSLKHGVLFPAIHFEEPHPQINFSKSAVFVQQQLQNWQPAKGLRTAGISSIGLSGTNCHIILQQAPPGEKPTGAVQLPYLLIPVSSKTQKGLLENIEALKEALTSFDEDQLPGICHTLTGGRAHYAYRAAFVVRSLQDLKQQLYTYTLNNPQHQLARKTLTKLIVVFDDDVIAGGSKWLDYFKNHFEIFRNHFELHKQVNATNYIAPPVFDSLLFRYCFYKLLEAYGITTTKMLARGTGKAVASVARDNKRWEEVLPALAHSTVENDTELAAKISNLVNRETTEGPVAFVSMGGDGSLSSALKQQVVINDNCLFIPFPATGNSCPFMTLIQSLYLLNYDVNWEQLATISGGGRLELPAYRFQKTRCWIRETPKTITAGGFGSNGNGEIKQGSDKKEAAVQEAGIASGLIVLFQEILAVDTVTPDDDFFFLGGDSLKATRLINRINAAYATNLSFEDVFDFPVVRSLAAYLEKTCTTAQKLYKIWKDVLKQEELGYDDNFFELGGHSLLANQVINRVRSQFNRDINFDDFFRFPTIRSMAVYLDGLALQQKKSMPEVIAVLPQQQAYEVSHAQKRIWILGQSTGGALAYNQPGLYEVKSALNVQVLKQSFDILIERHESLRTTFIVQEGELLQKIHPAANSGFVFEYKDYRPLANAKEAALLLANQQAAQPFNLEKGPLIRTLLVQTGDEEYIFLLDLHHIITDGWSNGVLIQDLLLVYKALLEGRNNPLPPLRIQYKEYAAWQNRQIRNGEMDAHRDYWMKQFSDEVQPLTFAELPRPAVKTFQGRIMEFSVDAELTEQLKHYCRQKDATLFMLLLANLYVLLYRFSGQQDIVIGTPVANRDHLELEDQVGFYVNMLPIRTQFNATESFEQLLQKVKTNTLNAYAHSSYPFDLLADNLSLDRDLSRSPLFDVLMALQNMENHRRYKQTALQDMQVTSYEPDIQISKFDLTIMISEQDGGLGFLIEYDTALFTGKNMQKIKDGFLSLFAAVAANPRLTINDLRSLLYNTAEKEQLDFYKAFSAIDVETGL